MGWAESSRALVPDVDAYLLTLTFWWSCGARRGVLHLDERVATADVDVVSRRLAVRDLLAVIGELDEAGLACKVGGELAHELVVRDWCVGCVVVVVVVTQYGSPRLLLVLRLRGLGLDEEAVHQCGWMIWRF